MLISELKRRLIPPAHGGRTALALVVITKLMLIIGALLLIELGAGYVAAGTSLLILHGVVVAVAAIFAVKSGALNRFRFGGRAHGRSDHSKGIILHGAVGYDLLARLLTFGRETRFRDLMLGVANLQPGQRLLDVGCGTGTLAIAAKRQVGEAGKVTGLDASIEMIERARAKAASAGLEISFVKATAQDLPFEESQFDIVMGTLMMHHLSKPMRKAFAQEARRVLKPAGRLLLIDFARPARKSRWPRLHRHGHVDMEAVGSMLGESGFYVIDIGDVGTKNLQFVRAAPRQADLDVTKGLV